MSATGRFTVRLSEQVARVVECIDANGSIEFTIDAGQNGSKSMCLEHHPKSWPRGGRYDSAFQQAKAYLESLGYEIEIFGE